ncbi:hypothetical protein CDD83_8455 [Cordyceps sp. RAO-2017]|nr:hypothetical protein CDD83_8455 [Cordyceps sp. RAO-2017]
MLPPRPQPFTQGTLPRHGHKPRGGPAGEGEVAVAGDIIPQGPLGFSPSGTSAAFGLSAFCTRTSETGETRPMQRDEHSPRPRVQPPVVCSSLAQPREPLVVCTSLSRACTLRQFPPNPEIVSPSRLRTQLCRRTGTSDSGAQQGRPCGWHHASDRRRSNPQMPRPPASARPAAGRRRGRGAAA